MNVTLTLSVIGVLAVLIGAYDYVRRARSRRGITSSSAIQKHFGLYAENRPILHLDPVHVPAELRHLVPLAEKWGIGDDIIRNDVINKSGAAEKRELHDSLYAPFERITEWLTSFAGRPLSTESEAFLYMQTTLDEMGYYILEEKRAASPESSA
jgi:hypothetical protein